MSSFLAFTPALSQNFTSASHETETMKHKRVSGNKDDVACGFVVPVLDISSVP